MVFFVASALLALLIASGQVLGVPALTGRQQAQCTRATFDRLLPAGGVIERVDSVRSGGSYGEGAINKGFPKNATKLPALCAVTARFTNSTTNFRFGLFLPAAADWKSKFFAVGSYSFAGGINWPDMGQGPHYGMATVATDHGHNGTADDLKWATPVSLRDWGYQAMHGAVVFGKQLTEAYYGKPIAYSYYSGCSTGGRNGLKEIQYSPDSFDGVLIGAPAWWTTHLDPWVGRIAASNLPTSAKGHIDVAQFATLAKEALQQCDAVDGHSDNIISWPEECKLDLSKILCANPNNPSNCLLAEQIQTAYGIYSDALSAKGDFLHNGFTVGSEAQWATYLAYGAPENWDTDYEKYWLYNDSTWDWARSGGDHVFADSDRINPGNSTADQYDISPFRDSGGKVLMYHGLADALVPTRGSVLYLNRTRAALGGADLAGFFRHFEIPGMAHCVGTPAAVNAPWYVGAGPQATFLLQNYNFGDGWGVPGQTATPQNDALLALLDWVEKGRAPDSLTATVWTASGQVMRTRPVCPYPRRATYKGSGSKDAAANWACQ